jgi:hypothetical protein
MTPGWINRISDLCWSGLWLYDLNILSDPGEPVRLSVTKTLGKIGDRRALPALGERLQDADERVQSRARIAIQQIERRNTPQRRLSRIFDRMKSVVRSGGVSGEIIYTPGHSDDSVTLILDEGMAFTGDLPYPMATTREAQRQVELGKNLNLWGKNGLSGACAGAAL